MDIIDIMLAKAMTPQGKTDAYVNKANKAAQTAAKAKQDAEAAVATVTAAAEDIAEAQSAAATLLETAQAALETAEAAQGELPTAYSTTGQNTDGYMTQKATTDALATKADASSLNNYVTVNVFNTSLTDKADKSYVDQQIANIPTGGSSSGGVADSVNLGSENSGKLVVVGSDGNIVSGTVLESELIEALIATGGYTARDAVGIEIDYDNKTIKRTQQAVGKSMGSDFNAYPMYGGRMRCNVADDGTINAFYGDPNFKESGNGQVMVYQPKFYYQRIPITVTSNKVGKTVIRDSLMISYTAQNGFKVHPIFKLPNGEELDYVLFSAYEGGLYDVSQDAYYGTTALQVDFDHDMMSSKINTKPITGSSGLSLQKAEQLANNRGEGWHIFNIQAESANQMLEVIEFGTFNGQNALGKGICNLGSGGNNIAAMTGATSSLGNSSGVAATTYLEANGSTTATSDNDKSAISYRGLENPWGNVWQMLNGILINGNTTSNGGVPYICKNGNYSYTSLTNDYESAGFSLPNNSGWISALGYGEKAYDWLLMPAEANNANSIIPIGDNGWFDSNLTGTRMVVHGGGWSFEESDGPFYYGCDKQPNDSTYKSYGARLMFIPTKNNIYTNNITKWQEKVSV